MIEYYKNLSLENLFYIDENGIIQEEEWRDVPNYVKKYQMSTLSRVKSLKREISGKRCVYYSKERILKQQINGEDRLLCTLTKNAIQTQYKTHQLMGIVFLNHIPCGLEKIVDHKNNNSLDNRLSNLQIITQSKNSRKDKSPKSGYNCIYFESNVYRVRFQHKGKTTNFGSFKTKEEAITLFNKIDKLVLEGKDISKYIKTKKAKVFKNITIQKGKYRVRITINKKVIRFPLFNTLEEAKSFVLKYRANNNLG